MSISKLALTISIIVMVSLTISSVYATGMQDPKQFLKIDIKDIVANSALTGTLTMASNNSTQSFPIGISAGQAISATAQFPYSEGKWEVSIENNDNLTILDLSGNLQKQGDSYVTSFDDTSYYLKQYLTLDRTDQSATITVGYSASSIAVYAQTKDNSNYTVLIESGNLEDQSVNQYTFTQSGPVINVSTPVIQGLPLLTNINVVVSSDNAVIANMNRTYDLATGVSLSGSKVIDDVNKIVVFDPIVTTIPYVAMIPLNNSDLIKATYSSTASAQTGMRIQDQTTIESVPVAGQQQTTQELKGNQTISSSTTAHTPEPSTQPQSTSPINWLTNSVNGLASSLRIGAIWIWVGIALGIILLLVAAVIALLR